MAEPPGTVVIVDDDPGLRESLGSLLRSIGLQVDLYGSVAEFMKAGRPSGATCLVLDVRLPGQSGLDFQRELSKAGISVPIVFITGHGDIPMSVKAMKGGAIEFMSKPVHEQDLLDAIQLGLQKDRAELEKVSALRGPMAKAEKAPKPSRKLTKKEQSERFKQTARELGCDESPGAMDRAFGQIDPKKSQGRPHAK
jgi:FixJ family two-component response regulator